ncbi:hypothetical protein H6784_05425 [Candidatus Nomurabacteria bacterium]|nr:hypothetical protein [Candidatus Kaiserbacteria bacterium]MCB9814820.1 hypothetical protein [Candidatus Nomurabacteria bacterium]
MKLISLNLEGRRHLDTALPFLEKEKADLLTLQEAPEEIVLWLKEQGYKTTFLARCLKTQDGVQYTDGEIIASKQPHQAETFYYYRPSDSILEENLSDRRLTNAQGLIFATVGNYKIATTHFTWHQHGEIAGVHQTTDMKTLLQYLDTKPPHVLCGDFNIPRLYNSLYSELISHYKDEIPKHYLSSLDRNLHKHGANEEIQKLFDSFMVDYVFTQPPYHATNTRLEFGVSDHAAVITTLSVDSVS